jgi:hypothetical protein
MADLVVVLGVLAFFGICVLFVRACDAIIGPDPTDAPAESDAPAEPDAVAAPTTEVVS